MNKLSSKHYLFFICVVSFIGLRSYSSIFISMGGADTWIAGIIAGIIYLAYLYFIIYVCKKTNTFDIKLIFKGAYPKNIGNIFIFIFALTLFLTSIESTAAQSDSIHSNIFIETPIWYSLLFFIIPAAYLITRRLETLLIVITVTIILVFSTMFIVELFTFSYQHYTYLLPIMGLGINKEFILCILLILGSFCSTAVTFPFLKYVEKKEKLSKFTLIAGLIIVFISVASVTSAVTTFGPLRASNIYYPEFLRTQRIELQGFIEFGDLLFISKTTCLWFLKYVLCAVAILYLYKDKFSNKRVYAIVYSIIAYICAFFITKNHYIFFDFLKYYQLIALVLLGIMPFITFAIYYYRWNKNLKAQAAGNVNTPANNQCASNNHDNPTNQGNSNNQSSPINQSNPNNQGISNTQGNSNNYGNPNNQGNPNNHDTPNNQGNPNNHDTPNNQGNPNNQGAPNTQGNPNNQGISNTQGNPNNYGNPINQGNSDNQGIPSSQGNQINQNIYGNQNYFNSTTNNGATTPNNFNNRNYPNAQSILNNQNNYNNQINSSNGNYPNNQSTLDSNNNYNNQNETNNCSDQDESSGSYVFGNYTDSQNNNQNNSESNNQTNSKQDFKESHISGNFFFPSGTQSKE
ncbi:endospore germination permease [Clostridium sardiniense]|uniref:Endospore germination permease n=1 Tax=Clostridium sardiniense TaxID=29369 RepID=A0ABS7KT77_CLOSR|nr:endospore germination permease [Clostridium sardiniense]MBY0753965.1 endospore germination permease [Clostridium sardiniense]